MCGFVVIVSLDGQPVSEQALIQSSASISHRGPDDEKIILRSNVGIAFRRLSINDLSKGIQPLWSDDNSTALVCNGEIYNSPSLKQELEGKGYQFKTGSDCEAIVPLYQQTPHDFISRIEGMFAFSIIDFEKQRITFGRDRFGIKPLYIYQDKSWLIIASEIKAIVATGLVPRECNARYVYDAFTFGFSVDQQTLIKNVSAVAPATICHLDFAGKKELITRTYWKPSFPERKGVGDLLGGNRAQEQIRETLSAAVESHLLSDVPVAAYLSGGLDSTITALLMKQFLPSELTTFSIGFEEAEFDESKIFRNTVKNAGFNGIEITARQSDISFFPEAIRAIEMLQFSPMDIPLLRLSERVNAEGIKVVLAGEGSDELFGGYSVFPWLHIASALRIPSISSMKDLLSQKALRMMGIPDSAHFMFNDVFSEESQTIVKEFGFTPAWLPYWRRRAQRCPTLFEEPENIFIRKHPALMSLGEQINKNYPKIDSFDAALLAEIKTRLPNYILHRTDRTSMKNSVEARVPFLDKTFSEAALACPPLLKTFGFKEKSVLRKAFKDILPSDFKSLRKFGYNAPNQWCWSTEAADLRSRYLCPEALAKSGLFNLKNIDSRIKVAENAFKTNRWDLESSEDASFVTGVMSFQILFEQYFDK